MKPPWEHRSGGKNRVANSGGGTPGDGWSKESLSGAGQEVQKEMSGDNPGILMGKEGRKEGRKEERKEGRKKE